MIDLGKHVQQPTVHQQRDRQQHTGLPQARTVSKQRYRVVELPETCQASVANPVVRISVNGKSLSGKLGERVRQALSSTNSRLVLCFRKSLTVYLIITLAIRP